MLSLSLTRPFHLNVKENQHATKRSLLVEKQKDFSDQKHLDSQPENSLSGVRTAGVERSTRQNFVASKLKVNFFVLLRVRLISITGLGHRIGVDKQRKFCRYVTCSQWKGEVWLQEIIRARLDTCLRLSTIDEVVSRRCKLRNRKTGE